MARSILSTMEMDAVGEIMNISLGSSATAVSNLLDHRVDITTPTVTVVPARDFTLGNLQPAVGVEIKYVSGLEGSNVMLLKRSDIKVIVDILMGSETPDDEFELNELTVSAVCEVMNQMMGAAATALSDFLGRSVNISPPQAIEMDDFEEFRKERFPNLDENIVIVRFALSIEGSLESEFMNIMSVPLARDLVAGFGLTEEDSSAPASEPEAQDSGDRPLSQAEIEQLMGSMNSEPETPKQDSGGKMSQEEIERLMGSMNAEPEPPKQDSGGKMSQEEIERLMGSMNAEPAPQPAAQPAPAPAQPAPQPTPQPAPAQAAAPVQPPQGMPQQAMPQQGMPPMGYPPMYGYPPYYYPYPEPPAQPDPKVIQTRPVPMPKMTDQTKLDEEQTQNLDLIMSVPLEVSVEIGRTCRKVQDILSFAKGSLVVLDKLAGDQVDLFVNGKCIARGDVVVIDDNFGIRISEILRKPDLEDLAHK